MLYTVNEWSFAADVGDLSVLHMEPRISTAVEPRMPASRKQLSQAGLCCAFNVQM